MTAAIRQTVTIQPGGIVHFASPDLREGTAAEVIVLVATESSPDHRLQDFHKLQKSLALTPAAARQWIDAAAAERKSFGPQ